MNRKRWTLTDIEALCLTMVSISEFWPEPLEAVSHRRHMSSMEALLQSDMSFMTLVGHVDIELKTSQRASEEVIVAFREVEKEDLAPKLRTGLERYKTWQQTADATAVASFIQKLVNLRKSWNAVIG